MPSTYQNPYQTGMSGLQRRQMMSQALMQQSLNNTGGVQSPLSSIANIASAMIGANNVNSLGREQTNLAQEQENRRKKELANAVSAYREDTPYQAETFGPEDQLPPGLMNQGAGKNQDALLSALLQSSDPNLQTAALKGMLPSGSSQGMPFYAVPTSTGYVIVDKTKGTAQPMSVQGMGGVQPPATNPDGTPANYPPLLPVSADPNVKAAMTQAGVVGKDKGEKVVAQPKREIQAGMASGKTEMLDTLIDQAKDQSGMFTTGLVGQMTSGIGGTPANDLQNTLNTVKANIGFDRLQAMRDSSPTGGALGQVSEMENRLLQAVWGSLEQSQSPEQLKANLERVRNQVKESWKRIADAYEKDYGVPLPADMAPQESKPQIKFLGFE